MKRRIEHGALINLGRATVETKGGPVGMDDYQGGRNPWPGLAAD